MNHELTMQMAKIKKLSNALDNYYNPELDFRNHCYLRIAYDNTVQNKWDLVVRKPFIKYANNQQLENAIILLNQYLIDKATLLADNKKSLNYRAIANEQETTSVNTLF